MRLFLPIRRALLRDLNPSLNIAKINEQSLRPLYPSSANNVFVKSYSHFKISAILIPQPITIHWECVRYKSKKRTKNQVPQEADADSDEEDNTGDDSNEDNEDGKVKIMKLKNIRLDNVLRFALGTSKRKAEELILQSKVLLNGRSEMRKGVDVAANDEIQIIGIGLSGESSQLSSITIKNIEPDVGKSMFDVHMSVKK